MSVLSAIPTVLIAIALIAIGAVIGPRAGVARNRMWVGIAILLIGQLLSLIWVFLPMLIVQSSNIDVLGVVSSLYGLISGAVFVAGVAVLASAIALAQRSGFGYLDPSRPGAAPGPVPGQYGSGSPYVPGPGEVPPPR